MQKAQFETAREVRMMVVGDRFLLKTKTEISKMMVIVAVMKVRGPVGHQFVLVRDVFNNIRKIHSLHSLQNSCC